jgi:phthiodiolone/phenolphthiodiolone dimycocerosates ketoreductase
MAMAFHLQCRFEPEQALEGIAKIKQILRDKGRDPESFGFGMFCPVLIHEDENRIDSALDNPLIRWFSGTTGRIDQTDWKKEGIDPVLPADWTYYQKMLPYDCSQLFIDEVVTKTTRKMAERSFFYGSPAQVARQMEPYIDAGVTWMVPYDCMPLILTPEDAALSLQRNIDVCAHLKGAI